MVSYEPWQSLVSSFKFDAVLSNPGNEISGKDIEKVTEFLKIIFEKFPTRLFWENIFRFCSKNSSN